MFVYFQRSEQKQAASDRGFDLQRVWEFDLPEAEEKQHHSAGRRLLLGTQENTGAVSRLFMGLEICII